MSLNKLSTGPFGSAVEGKIPDSATVSDAAILGKTVTGPAALAAFGVIGAGVEQGTLNLSQAAMTAKAAHIELVEPPSYVAKDPDVQYTTKYKYDPAKNENIGGGPAMDPKVS